LWEQAHYTGGSFPRVFYLNYHGYQEILSLWARALSQPKAAIRRTGIWV
jgi:hypothetical protein